MSRCFPYPPSGYVRNGIRDEALIESIKLQREGQKAEKERKKDKKDKKREKKEKHSKEHKKDKKEKHKKDKEHKKDRKSSHKPTADLDSSKSHHSKKRNRDEKSPANEKGSDHLHHKAQFNKEQLLKNEKGSDLQHKAQNEKEQQLKNGKGSDLQHKAQFEKEQLENSGLTEEHGHPVGSQNSSDSTLDSQKRQKLSPSPDGGQNSSSIIRIRLPLQRQNGPDALPNKEQPCIASERTDELPIQAMQEPALTSNRDKDEHPCSTSSKVSPDVNVRHKEEHHSIRKMETQLLKQQKTQASTSSSLCRKCPPDLALKFRDVIGNWVPPPPLPNQVTDVGDDDWLFTSKENQNHGLRRHEDDIVGPSFSWPPKSCLLPEVDIYALPFTVPY